LSVWQQLRLLRARWWVLVACALVGTASAFLVSNQSPRIYAASATLIAQTMASTFADAAVSRSVLAYVANELALSDTPEDLAPRVHATASLTSSLLTITVSDSDPARAASVATAIANRLVQLAPDITGSPPAASGVIQDDLNTVQTEIARVQTQLGTLSANSSPTPAQNAESTTLQTSLVSMLALRSSLLNLAISNSKTLVTILDPATPPTAPASPRVALSTAIGALLGLAVGMGVALLLGYREHPVAEKQS
jgi:succinoglycan biosynthesis transport protein ExoP